MTSSPTAAITPIVMSSVGGVLLLPTAIVLPVFFHEQFVYFVLGVFTDAFDQRYGERLLVRIRGESGITEELDEQPQPQHDERDRHDQLGGPDGQPQVDRAVAEAISAQGMFEAVPDQHRDHDYPDQNGDGFDDPER